MKKIILSFLVLAAGKSGSRTYVNHTEGQFSIADDTLIFQDSVIINRSGFQKIRSGDTLAKQYQVKQWALPGPDAPIIGFDGKHVFWNNTIYVQLP